MIEDGDVLQQVGSGSVKLRSPKSKIHKVDIPFTLERRDMSIAENDGPADTGKEAKHRSEVATSKKGKRAVRELKDTEANPREVLSPGDGTLKNCRNAGVRS